MAKPRLEKVRALFYVLQHIQEGASNFDTPSGRKALSHDSNRSAVPNTIVIRLIRKCVKSLHSVQKGLTGGQEI